MYQEIIENFLNKNKIKYTILGDEITCHCLNPKHKDNNPSFSINTLGGYYHCFSCGYSGHISKLTDIKIDEETQRAYEYHKLLEQMTIEPELPYDSLVVLPPKAFDITWEVRGIPKEIIEAQGIYYCKKGKYRGRLIFPLWDVYGELTGYTSWIASEESLGDRKDELVPIVEKYNHAKYLHSFGLISANTIYPTNLEEFELKTTDYIILCEGVFDALSYIALGYPAVCNFGVAGPSLEKIGSVLALGYPTIVQAFDNDKAGIDNWQKIKYEWSKHIPIHAPIPIVKQVWASGCKDANDYINKGK